MDKYISEQLAEAAAVFADMMNDPELQEAISTTAEFCVDAVKGGGKVMFCGNGGSAADAQHLAAELVGRFAYNRPPIAALALTTDTSIITAVGNDFGYERIFSQQVEALGYPGDVLIGLSTSGNSANVVKAFEAASFQRVVKVAMTGSDPGLLGPLADVVIRTPSRFTARIQEGHGMIGHILCGLIEQAIHPK